MARIKIAVVTIVALIIVAGLVWLIANYPIKQCDSINYAWSPHKEECTCQGIKVDTSCGTKQNPCPDAPITTGCIGKILEKRCFTFGGWNSENTSNAIWNAAVCTK